MRSEVDVDIEACPDHVWAVLTDVTRWPAWTTAVREVRLLGGSVMGLGSVVKVRSAGLPDRVWRVSEFVRQRSFTWSARGLGAHATVRFSVRPAAPHSLGRTRVSIEHERDGWVAGLVQRATARTVARHLDALTDELKQRCEQRRPAAVPPVA